MKPQVLMISKPLIEPWDDSGKNIVKNQVECAGRYSYRVLSTPSAKALGPQVKIDPLYPDTGSYSAGLKQNFRVMLHGLRPKDSDAYHYFFAPNPLSSFAGKLQKNIARVPTVQTVSSAPTLFDGVDRLLFADRIIFLSEDTLIRIKAAGVDESRLRLVRPCIEFIDKPTDKQKRTIRREHGLSEDSPLVVFPGDYEFSRAAQTVADMVPLLPKDVTVVFACRMKTNRAKELRKHIETQTDSRAVFLDRVIHMPSFVGAADVVVMPSERLYAKMDAPLVLLEAMSQQVPLVIADVPPLGELLHFGAGIGVPPANSAALAEAVNSLLQDSKLRMSLGTNGAAAVKKEFCAQTMTQKIESIYDEVI